MLQKSKSKQAKLLKYALLIPVVIGMLMYSSCEKESEINQSDALDLNQYTFTEKIGTKLSDEQLEIRNNLNTFLSNNSTRFEGWAQLDGETRTMTYSVHNKGEEVPLDYESIGYSSNPKVEDGQPYKMFIYIKEEYGNAAEVPFSVIDQVPIFPGCENMTNDEQKKCVSQKITEHVGENFNRKIPQENNLKGSQRINVIFKIDKEGNIVGVRARAPHPALEAEARRVINMLPKMIPGKQRGQNVTVPYSLPIVFQVQE